MFRGHALAILALISAALMPFGYMPARAADGSFILRICDGTVSAQVPGQATHSNHVAAPHLAMKGSDVRARPGHDEAAHELRCNYAVTAVADLPSSPQIEVCPIEPQATEGVPATPITGIFPAKLPPATGPPAG